MKICKFCGTENQASVKTCSSCGGYEFKNKCSNCGTIFEEGNFCSKCGVKAGVLAKKCPSCDAEYYSVACPDCGYTKNSDSITEVYITRRSEPDENRKTWLWVLGWLLIFPVPVTILLLRNQKLNKWIKGVIISLAWLVFIAMMASAPKSNNKQVKTGESLQEVISESQTKTSNIFSGSESESENIKESAIEDLVRKYNSSAENQLVFFEDFVVSDEESSHYRIAFRLASFENAVGKSYKMDDQIVDIISTLKFFENTAEFRIYSDGATLEQCKELIQHASKILDPTLTDEKIKETIDYVSENKKANGYYFGKLGLLLLGNEDRGFDIMIKN